MRATLSDFAHHRLSPRNGTSATRRRQHPPQHSTSPPATLPETPPRAAAAPATIPPPARLEPVPPAEETPTRATPGDRYDRPRSTGSSRSISRTIRGRIRATRLPRGDEQRSVSLLRVLPSTAPDRRGAPRRVPVAGHVPAAQSDPVARRNRELELRRAVLRSAQPEQDDVPYSVHSRRSVLLVAVHARLGKVVDRSLHELRQ